MPNALELTATASLAANTTPMLLGNVIHLDAEDAVSDGGSPAIVTVPDYYRPVTHAPVSGATSPSIGTDGDFKHLSFTTGKGYNAANDYTFSGRKECTGYIELRLISQVDNGVIFEWQPVALGGGVTASVIIRKNGANGNSAFLIDFGVNALTLTHNRTLNQWTIITFGWSAVSNEMVFGWGEDEVTQSAGGNVFPAAAYKADNFSIGQRLGGTLTSVMDLRRIISRGEYHSAAQRATFRKMMLARRS